MESVNTVQLLAISGSLRKRSSNTEVLRALALLAPASVLVTLYSGLDSLPFFNPDLDQESMEAPPAVRDFRARIGEADALFICSPEYAHGVPGVLKNALDWLVSAPEIVDKPIGLVNASPRSTHAPASLAETLRTMSTTIVPAASVTVPVSGRPLDASAIAGDLALAGLLRGALEALVLAVGECRERRRLLRGSSAQDPRGIITG
jgi:chromate reductase, NAD(P)H dehydrogenase (quinone)